VGSRLIHAVTLLAITALIVCGAGSFSPSAWCGADKAVELDASYRLQSGDRLNLKIYPEDEYIKGGEVEISSEGNITLPLVGKIGVGEKSVIEAEKTINELLAIDYLVNPQVVIEVLEYRKGSFVVLGQVIKPGTYDFPPGELNITLLHAISLTGGFSDVANIKKIKIMRKTTGEVLNVNAQAIIGGDDPDIEIKPDDVIHISESLF